MTITKFSDVGLHVGQADAPVKVTSFVNFRCPFCASWHFKANNVLDKYVKAGQVEEIIKFYDKPKETLEIGNHAHHFIDYNDPESEKIVNLLFSSQDEWGNLSKEELTTYFEENFGLKELENHQEATNLIIAEANGNNVKTVPTIFVGDKVFDSQVSPEELVETIEALLAEK